MCAFLPISFCQKITKPKWTREKLREALSYEKHACKMLMKLTPGVNFNNLCNFSQVLYLFGKRKSKQKLSIKCWWYWVPVVNFNNILRAKFSHKSLLHSFFVITYLAYNFFWQKKIGAKVSSQMLVKLNTALHLLEQTLHHGDHPLRHHHRPQRLHRHQDLRVLEVSRPIRSNASGDWKSEESEWRCNFNAARHWLHLYPDSNASTQSKVSFKEQLKQRFSTFLR